MRYRVAVVAAHSKTLQKKERGKHIGLGFGSAPENRVLPGLRAIQTLTHTNTASSRHSHRTTRAEGGSASLLILVGFIL